MYKYPQEQTVMKFYDDLCLDNLFVALACNSTVGVQDELNG